MTLSLSLMPIYLLKNIWTTKKLNAANYAHNRLHYFSVDTTAGVAILYIAANVALKPDRNVFAQFAIPLKRLRAKANLLILKTYLSLFLH